MKKQFKILSIDGGGMKGFLPCYQLIQLEKHTGKQCYELFDLIAGTSIGGILASLLALGIPAIDCLTFFTNDGPNIFRGRWYSLFGLYESKYSGDVINGVLQKHCGTKQLSDCKTKLVIPSYNLKTKSPFIFRNYFCQKNLPVWKVCRSTSAAPIYFPAFEVNEEIIAWDGGLVDNDPATIAYFDSVKLGESLKNTSILSIGCGLSVSGNNNALSLINAGAVRIGLNVLDALFEASEDEVDHQLQSILDNRYVRINNKLTTALTLDGVSRHDLNNLKSEAEQMFRSNKKKLFSFV